MQILLIVDSNAFKYSRYKAKLLGKTEADPVNGILKTQ